MESPLWVASWLSMMEEQPFTLLVHFHLKHKSLWLKWFLLQMRTKEGQIVLVHMPTFL
jgi:hypothetical protein